MPLNFYLICGGSLAFFTILTVLVPLIFVHDYNFWPIAVALVCGLAALGFLIILLINPLTYRNDKINCYKFAENSGRTVKFVKYSTWSWDCLTPTSSGHWIPISQLRTING